MDPKLLEILKKAKQVDERAKKYDSGEVVATNKSNTKSPGLMESVGVYEETPSTYTPKKNVQVDVNSDVYKERVKSSKLPPEIQKLMLENPIPQVDSPGTFSMPEEMIKEVNPNYGNQNNYSDDDDGYDFMTEQRHVVKQQPKNTNTVNAQAIRKMIAEEIAKALPSIVEKYFDKKMIQENVKALNAIRKVKRTNNNT
jgi:hypothetical protein